MRYATVVLDPSRNHETFNDLRRVWVDDELVATYEAIHDLNPLADGTVTMLLRLTGDIDRFIEIEEEISDVLYISTSRQTGLVYAHFEPGDLDTALFEIVDTHEVSVNWPVTYTEEGFQLTLFGEETVLRGVVEDLSEAVDVTLEKTGNYQPRMRDPTWHLTDRQCEIVRVAIREGYYDLPRQASQRDLAATLELSRGTIAEHLRKAEANIMRAVMD